MVWKYKIIFPFHIKRQTIDKRNTAPIPTVKATAELF